MRSSTSNLSLRAAVILAGGEGLRMRSVTRFITGQDDVPKQFCPLLEQETLLQLTLRRVALAVDPARTLTVVTRSHDRPETMKRTVAMWHDQHR